MNDKIKLEGEGKIILEPKIILGANGFVGISSILATESYYTDKTGTPQKSTTTIPFIYWCSSDVAKELGLKKFDRVYIKGTLEQSKWEENGKQRHAYEIKVQEISKEANHAK